MSIFEQIEWADTEKEQPEYKGDFSCANYDYEQPPAYIVVDIKGEVKKDIYYGYGFLNEGSDKPKWSTLTWYEVYEYWHPDHPGIWEIKCRPVFVKYWLKSGIKGPEV